MNKNVKTSKGGQTRALILETAMELFREQGYDRTTMRAIAERAGVAVGNAYYYFRSKDHIIQAFYGRMHRDHLTECAPVLRDERDLKARLLGVVKAKIETLDPYHEFAGALFKTAADPRSPLNPFSVESDPVRRESIALFSDVVNGCRTKLPRDLKTELPYLLWLYHMGVILFWIHDGSAGRARTRRLIDLTVDLVLKLILLAGNPFMRPFRKATVRLVVELRGELA